MAPHARLLTQSPYRIIDQDPSWVGPWIESKGAGHWRSGSTCIGLAREGELTAGTMYDNFNGASVFASIAIAGPITRSWLWYIFYYPFIQLNAKVILGLVSQENEKSHHLCDRFGFTPQAMIKDADPSGFLIVYKLHRNDCRFIEEDLKVIHG